MRTHVEYDPREGAFRVWCFTPSRASGATTDYAYTPDGNLAPAGERPWGSDEPAPTLVLPYEIVEALLENREPGLSPRDATADALRDARAVRDRVLSLVERLTDKEGE